jgi:hypothetical protein
MSTTVDQSFVKMFDADVSVAYQREGSKLRNMVRFKEAKADSVRFQKYGTGSLGTKSRHGMVPVMNADHSFVEVTMADYYGGEYIDDLDEVKTNIDERGLAANALAMAAGRKVDERIVTVATATSVAPANAIAAGGASFTKTKVLQMVEQFGNLDIPDDGNRGVLVSPDAWVNGLLNIAEFSSADYIGTQQLPWASGITAKRWMGFLWMQFTGLSIASTTRTCLAWHKPALGLGMAKDLTVNFDWVPEKASYFSQVRISMEAVTIRPEGLMKIDVTET